MTDAQADAILKKLQHWQAKAIERADAHKPNSVEAKNADAEAVAFGRAYYLVLDTMRES